MNFSLNYLIYISAAFYAAAVILYLLRRYSISHYAVVAGFISGAVFMVQRGWTTGVFIPNGMFEGVFLMPAIMAGIIILLRGRSGEDNSYLSSTVILLIFSMLAVFYPKGIIPPTPNKLTVWANIFFFTEVAGHSCFYIGGWLAAVSLVKKDSSNRYHSLLVWGFVLYSIAQVTGAVWAFMGWGSVFRWGSRHLQSAVIWCYFAAYIHLKFMPLWQRPSKLIYAAFGIAVTAACSLGSYLHEMKFPRLGGL